MLPPSLTEQNALILNSAGAPLEIGKRPIPKIGPNDVLIKVRSAALNPVDWILQAYPNAIPVIKITLPTVLGVDSSGIVEEVGKNVKRFQKGDKVFHPSSFAADRSAFQEYTLASEELMAEIPSNVSFDQAATIPFAIAVAAVGLYNTKENNLGAGLYPPWEQGGVGKYASKPFVIFGGATSVGQFGIQLAKLSGFSPIITTASEHNDPLLKSFGATHVLSRNLSVSELESAIKDIVGGKPIEIVYDAVSTAETQQLGWDVLGVGGSLVTVNHPLPINKRRQEGAKQVVLSNGGVHFSTNFILGAKLYAKLTEWLECGSILPNNAKLLPNGLLGVAGGLERLKKNEVSGIKLVVRIQETPWNTGTPEP